MDVESTSASVDLRSNEELLYDWLKSTRDRSLAHASKAASLRNQLLMLSLAATAFSSASAVIAGNAMVDWHWVAMGLSSASALCSTATNLLDHSKRRAGHLRAELDWEVLSRSLKVRLAQLNTMTSDDVRELVLNMQRRVDTVSATAPPV